MIADSNVIIARLITLFAASADIKQLTQEQRAIAHAATRMVEEHLAQTGFYYRYGKLAHAVHIWSHAQAHTHMRVCTTASVKPCVGIHGVYHVHAGLHMPEFYDVLPRQHIPMVDLPARMPSVDPTVNFSTPVELGYDTTAAVAESTRCLMCNYNIWFDPFRCVLCGACADVCPEGVIHMVDVNQLKTEGLLPEIEEAYGWSQGAAMILDEERCIRCALCVKRCPFDAITMERFELQEISSDGRLYKESYRDAQLAGTAGVAGGA